MLIIVIETHCNAVDYGKKEIRKWFEIASERQAEVKETLTLVTALSQAKFNQL